jgi:hypothetical protein
MKKTLEKPEILLASFPRSGNTFLRNILMDVFSVYSWNNIEVYKKAQKNFRKYEQLKKLHALPAGKERKLEELRYKLSFPIIKTHEIPSRILPFCETKPKIIYLVRDGRDALVSMAHHRKDIIQPGTDFVKNLKESIRAPMGTYFGGWGKNVSSWTEIAQLVIHFESLVNNPEKEIPRIREFLGLSEPVIENIPTFDSQRSGGSHFGGKKRKKLSKAEQDEFNAMFFRSGKTGSWKEDMPDELHKKFWKKYGDVMLKTGYQKDGTFKPQ